MCIEFDGRTPSDNTLLYPSTHPQYHVPGSLQVPSYSSTCSTVLLVLVVRVITRFRLKIHHDGLKISQKIVCKTTSDKLKAQPSKRASAPPYYTKHSYEKIGRSTQNKLSIHIVLESRSSKYGASSLQSESIALACLQVGI